MFGYRHHFHAGNFADAAKHVILVSLLQSLKKKEKPFYFHDCHGGIGLYDLDAEQAQKNREFDGGVGQIWKSIDAPEAVSEYLQLVKQFNPDGALRYYPGSPRLGRALLRDNDRMAVTEFNIHDFDTLKQEFRRDSQAAIHHQDAYQGLKALLPPKERRGLVLIDPPYELKDEYTNLVKGLAEAHKRWATGIYAIWYPLMSRSIRETFLQQIIETGIRRVLLVELMLERLGEERKMCGTGMLIINPPWQLDEQLNHEMHWLWQQLSPNGEGGVTVEWLVPE